MQVGLGNIQYREQAKNTIGKHSFNKHLENRDSRKV